MKYKKFCIELKDTTISLDFVNVECTQWETDLQMVNEIDKFEYFSIGGYLIPRDNILYIFREVDDEPLRSV